MRIRDLLLSWLDQTDSEQNRVHKTEQLTRAFGLPSGYIDTYLEKSHSMGTGLMIEIDGWVRQNWDISLNSPAGPAHILSSVDTSQG